MVSEASPEARFVAASLSVLCVRVTRSGVIVAANRHAEVLIGEALAGRPFEAMLPDLAGNPSFPAWLSDPAEPRVLTVRTASSVPKTLRVMVVPDGEDVVLFGEDDSDEQAKLGLELIDLNNDLNNLSRDLSLRNADLARVIKERDGLLRETHHRVKNNLALITSLMRIAAGRSLVPETRAVLGEMQTRIHSVTALNEALYKTARYTTVELADYLKQIANHLFRAQAPAGVRLHLDVQPVEVATARAVPCGLITNELLTNSLKHGFPEGRGGEVRVTLRREPDRVARLRISDDGVGLPPDLGERTRDSLGMQLVGDLVRQIGGSLAVGPGATFTIVF